jgi:hypothetical protein
LVQPLEVVVRDRLMLLAGPLALLLASVVPAAGQDAPRPRPAAAPAAAAEDTDATLLNETELDDLVAPVALYPDSLLAQVLVAATYPLDLVKADRFIADNPDLADSERADRVETMDWDESVQVLAGGFPTVVQRMAADLDWTERLGDAMLAQSDGVFDAVQRMRARAEASGALSTNEAQTVASEGDTISIAPTDPGVVYVPAYDPATAFTSAPTAPVVIDGGVSSTDLLTTGAVAFGSAMLVDAIFDDDDDDWDDYWHGPPVIDWDDDDFRPRPGIDVDGDVDVDIDRSRDRIRIGDGDPGNGWQPTPAQRDEARDRIAARKQAGGGAGAGEAAKIRARRDADDPARARMKAAVAERTAAPERVRQKPASAMHRSADRPKAAAQRGATSLKRDHTGAATKARSAAGKRPAAVHKPAHAKPAVRKAGPKHSAFKSHGGGRAKAHAASRRGGHSVHRRR